ncbi:hypothetical protein OS493_016095 [Desmophyllum pertusum]|uniref:G-protein coupled receptors family 2 profile 2 domain-containing protein n=1 Tax=Desmophyllum pertusum TaxID=174260 RepID=A0A9X0A1L6_9CNID|nr:hypothetical protein OS493_016095 [Desmophyllum pertusum]
MESNSSEKRTYCTKSTKSLKVSRSTLFYYVGHLVLVITVTLPTIFYVLQPAHPTHNSSNETTSLNIDSTMNSSNAWRARNLTTSQGFLLKCNSPLVPDNETGQCRPPCAWTTQSPLTQKVYYIIIVVGLWMALISTVITFITWASIKNLRKFPHVLRFHIMVCCIILANSKMLPIHRGAAKGFCRGQKFWLPTGHSSIGTVIQGATSHYFGLAHSFWTMCFIANTYAVIIQANRGVFKHPIKFHLIQSVLCWLGPAIIVAGCLYFAPPGYKFLSVDLMTAGPGSIQMAYFAVTLPMQVTLGVSLCLLWSIVWYLRKARLDSTKRVIRAREERVSMRRIERQFLSMAVAMLLVVGVVLIINTVTIYCIRDFVHDAEVYFKCLQVSTNCKPPTVNSVLPLISVVTPGFACLVFFFLLFMNKDCRNIWKTCFRKVSKVFELCKPAPMKIRAYTDRSRCSSTLTVLSDRRESVPSFLFQGNVPRLDLTKPRASSLNLPVNKQRIALSNLDIEIRVTPPPNELDTKSRCHSVPIFLLNNLKELDSQRNNDINTTTYPVNRLSGEFGSVDSLNHSDDSDVNSEAPMERVNFIREMSEYSSKL